MTDKSLFNFTAAVIGTGYIGIQHLEALKSVVSEVVVCNVDAESGKATAEKYGCRFYSDYTEMFKKEMLESESFPYYLQSESLIFNEITYFCHCLANKIRTEMCEPEQVCKSLEISFAESESMMNNKIVEISR